MELDFAIALSANSANEQTHRLTPNESFDSLLSLVIIIVWMGQFHFSKSLAANPEFKDFSHTSRTPECYRKLLFTASDPGPKTCAKSSIFDSFLSVSNCWRAFAQFSLRIRTKVSRKGYPMLLQSLRSGKQHRNLGKGGKASPAPLASGREIVQLLLDEGDRLCSLAQTKRLIQQASQRSQRAPFYTSAFDADSNEPDETISSLSK